MTPERVLQHPPLVLEQRQRERYFEDGFLTVPGYVGAAWLDRLRAVVAAKIEESRMLTRPPTTSSTWRRITPQRSRTSDGCARPSISTPTCGRSPEIRPSSISSPTWSDLIFASTARS